MANKVVKLIRLCKTPNGWRRYPAVKGNNGRLRPEFAMVRGVAIHYPMGRYQLRSFEGNRQVYTDISDPKEALEELKQAEAVKAAQSSAAMAGMELVDSPGRIRLNEQREKFISQLRDRGKKKAVVSYGLAVDDFLIMLGKTWADEVTANDLLKHQSRLRLGQMPGKLNGSGVSARTILNRHSCVMAFLKYCELDVKKLSPRRPEAPKKRVVVYTKEELDGLFRALESDKHRLTFSMFLMAGLRELELVYLNWNDIDLRRGIVQVRVKDDRGFEIKDREERDIRIPDALVEELKKYRSEHPEGSLVFPTRTGEPNYKLLRMLKRIVKKANLGCTRCPGCKSGRDCNYWKLKTFRSTCITTWLRNRIDVRSVMKQSGHSDLETVLLYLSPAEDEVLGAQVNQIEWT